MFHRPYPSAWRIGADLIQRSIVQPLRRRIVSHANFWSRRDVFYKPAPPEPLAPILTPQGTGSTLACVDVVCDMVWSAQMRQLLWLATDLPEASSPDTSLHYAELRPEYLLKDLREKSPVQVAFIVPVRARLGPLRVSSAVDRVLSKEPWFNNVPFAYTYLLATTLVRKTRPQMATETAIPTPVTPKAGVLPRTLAKPRNRTQNHTASILNDLPLRSLRASTANSRSRPYRQTSRRGRAGQR